MNKNIIFEKIELLLCRIVKAAVETPRRQRSNVVENSTANFRINKQIRKICNVV